jgi:hypothetical protein
MQTLKSTFNQPRYIKRETVKGLPEECLLLAQGQFKGSNYAVIDDAEYPIGMVEFPCDPKSLPEVSINGLRASKARFCDMTWVSKVEVSKTGDSIMVQFSFNKNGDYNIHDAESNDATVRELNDQKQKWTSEEVLFELLTFINGLES